LRCHWAVPPCVSRQEHPCRLGALNEIRLLSVARCSRVEVTRSVDRHSEVLNVMFCVP
jgi:hypothetical protein